MSKAPLPETILQFGGGNFLRGFVDVFVHEANEAGHGIGRIVVVQSTRSGVAETINRQGGRYHVVTRGLKNGQKVDQVQEITSLSRAIDAESDWAAVKAVAASPDLRMIVSNTTEAGFVLDPADTQRTAPAPRSFPAKLLDVLWYRYEQLPEKPPAILPCELLPKNGEKLLQLVLQQATLWNAPPQLIDWLQGRCAWGNSLVDRIVSGKPAEHPLLATDGLLTVTEPFALWAVEADDRIPLFPHPAIQRPADTGPYELRKVRSLNGAHTALVAKVIPMGLHTVREAVQHPQVGPWLQRLLSEEIVPTIRDRVPDVDAFVADTLERFANPFLEHKLSSIALNHEAKLKTRLVPTQQEYVQRFAKRPVLLDGILSPLS